MKALTGGFQKLKATVSDAEATLQEELGFEMKKGKAEETTSGGFGRLQDLAGGALEGVTGQRLSLACAALPASGSFCLLHVSTVEHSCRARAGQKLRGRPPSPGPSRRRQSWRRHGRRRSGRS